MNVKESLNRLKEVWKRSNIPIKLIIPALTLGIIILILVNLFATDKYTTLYTGLNSDDSLEVQQYLSTKGVDYKLENAGSDILVNGDIILIKRDLALQNIPQGDGVGGLASFDNMSIGSTKFDKEIQYQNKLQEELQNSIVKAFDGVVSANVKLPRLQEKSIFEENNENTTISVAIKTKEGFNISEENVRAIQVFVASSIQEVSAEDVEIVDSDMKVLSKTSEENSFGSDTSKQSQILIETKERIEDELTSTLKEVYGKVKVIANVDINFDEIVQNIETYDPEGTIISREEASERIREVTKEAADDPGTDQNGEVPNYEIENLDETDALYLKDKENLIENFVVGKTVEKIIKHPELRNVNVAVWVDTDLDYEEIVELEEMVAVSSGITGVAERVENNKAVYDNGSVKVTQRAFVDQVEVPVEVGEKEANNHLYWYIISGALLFIILIVVVILIMKRRNDKEMIFDINENEENVNINENINEKSDGEGLHIENTDPEEEDEETLAEENGADTEDDEYLEKFDFEWTEEQRDLRALTNDVSAKYPKETADVIKRLMKKD